MPNDARRVAIFAAIALTGCTLEDAATPDEKRIYQLDRCQRNGGTPSACADAIERLTKKENGNVQ
jgi:hypothetical protein